MSSMPTVAGSGVADTTTAPLFTLIPGSVSQLPMIDSMFSGNVYKRFVPSSSTNWMRSFRGRTKKMQRRHRRSDTGCTGTQRRVIAQKRDDRPVLNQRQEIRQHQIERLCMGRRAEGGEGSRGRGVLDWSGNCGASHERQENTALECCGEAAVCGVQFEAS